MYCIDNYNMQNFSFLIPLLYRAGDAVTEVYKTNFDVEWKGFRDPVTKADLEANRVLLEELSKSGYPILSEESEDDKNRLGAEYVWLVDPLDGTGSFIRRNDEFCIMVALLHHDKPVFGAVYLPVQDTLYYAEKDKGAYVQEQESETRISVSEQSNPHAAHAVTSRTHLTGRLAELLKAIAPAQQVRVGSNGIKAGCVADGRADFFINPTNKMGEWDIAAPHIIVEEAGGKVTGAFGEQLVYNKEVPKAEHGILATNGVLHEEILSAVASGHHGNS